jgi:putative addiction module killer protein
MRRFTAHKAKGSAIVILLVGGDKSTQKTDIAKAKELADNI